MSLLSLHNLNDLMHWRNCCYFSINSINFYLLIIHRTYTFDEVKFDVLQFPSGDNVYNSSVVM